MYRLIRFFLFLLPPETSHNISLKALSFLHRIGLLRPLFGIKSTKSKPINVMGIDFPNGVGLAAGLDKNGDHIDALASLGFGFIEIGTVTPRPQPGNPLPRLFRLPESEAIINRMGFNNKGVDYLIDNVKKAKFDGVLGINIGKNFDTKVEDATSDYLICLKKVYPHASYITVNISSPNTPGLRTLQYGEELRELIQALKAEQKKLADQYKRYIPIAIKVAPDLEANEIEAMSAVFLEEKIDALIATNTTLARDAVAGQTYADEQGGLSGKPVTQKSTDVIRQFYQHLGDAVPIIGIGGISSTDDAKDKLQAGASLVQIYTGFIYQGSNLISKCLQAFKNHH